MTPTRRQAGFTLVEMSTVVGIIAILAALAYAALEVLPQRTRLTGSALEFSAVISAARSHSYGRNQRVVVLLNASNVDSNDPIQYWVVVDNWSNMERAMQANTEWNTFRDLTPGLPAPAGSEYMLFDSGRFNPSVRVVKDGFKHAIGPVPAPGCALVSDKIDLAAGPTPVSNAYPPPYCFVPADRACTFCTGEGADAKKVRGAIFFEPDGTVLFFDAHGVESAQGSASITLTPARSAELKSVQSIVITNTGLVRTFSATR